MTDAEKITAIRDYYNLTWVNFAKLIGIPSPQTFVDIRSGRHGLSDRIRNHILEAMPDISAEWLNNGEGPMVVNENNRSLPFVNNEGGLSFNGLFPNANSVLRYFGKDMVEYPTGAVLILKAVGSVDAVVPGNNYVIATNDYIVVKRVQMGSDSEHITLYSTNTESYPDGRLVHEPFEVRKDAVTEIYTVLGYALSSVSE